MERGIPWKKEKLCAETLNGKRRRPWGASSEGHKTCGIEGLETASDLLKSVEKKMNKSYQEK